jgi:hypothetical protein
MANAGRIRLHQIRKRAIGALERLWPSLPLTSVSELLVEARRSRIPLQEDQPLREVPDLPPLTRKIFAAWAAEDDFESIRRITRPTTIDPEMGIVFVGSHIVWGTSDMPARERAARFLSHLRANMVRPARRLDRAILLHHVFGANYFHFFAYVVGKAYVAEKHGLPIDIPFLVPEHTARTRFFREASELGLFGRRPVVIQGRGEVIGVDEAYLIRNFDCDRLVFDWALERIATGIEPVASGPIMLVRGAGATNARQYRNQEAINAIAHMRGVTIFDPGEWPIRDQIARFAGANAIIGAHGAGLTNMMFRRTGDCAVLELFNPDLGTPHYYLMARQRGFDYRWLMSRDPIGKNNVATSELPVEAFTVALDALLASLPA